MSASAAKREVQSRGPFKSQWLVAIERFQREQNCSLKSSRLLQPRCPRQNNGLQQSKSPIVTNCLRQANRFEATKVPTAIKIADRSQNCLSQARRGRQPQLPDATRSLTAAKGEAAHCNQDAYRNRNRLQPVNLDLPRPSKKCKTVEDSGETPTDNTDNRQ